MPRVGINAQLLSGEASYRRAGIHHYIDQLVKHLPPDPNWAYTLFRHSGISGRSFPAHLEQRVTSWPTQSRLARVAWEQSVWPWQARQMKLDLLHSMAFIVPRWRVCPVVATIYDLSFVAFPDRFPAVQRWYLRRQTMDACRRATRLIAISESGRQDLHRFGGVPLDRIDVVYPGVGPAYAPLPASAVTAFRQQRSIEGTVILHVGTLQPRKNLTALIEAFGMLMQRPAFQRQDVTLLLVGGKGWLYDAIFDRVAELGLRSRVRFTGYVSDAELPYWYNLATVLVFPSVYEGFGLPVAQAMACGTPVIAANTSSIPEVAGGAALLFEPDDTLALCDHLANVLQDRQRAANMSEAGTAQVQQFRWERSGKDLQLAYQRAVDA